MSTTANETAAAPATTRRPTVPRAPRTVAPADDTKAQVVKTETITYTKEKPDDAKTSPQVANQNASTNNIPRANVPMFFDPRTSETPRNSLERLAEVLEDDGQETYIALITRLADMFNDNYLFPCASVQAFPPMQFNVAGMLLNFIPYVTKFNNNSGGRFDIRICDIQGQPIEDAALRNFSIANPPREISNNGGGNGETAALMEFIRVMQDQNQQFQVKMLAAISDVSNPKSDRFADLAEQVLMNKLASDGESKGGNAQEMMMQMLMMPEMVKTFAEQFRNAMNTGNDKNAETSTMVKLAESPFGEAIGARAGDILAGLTQAAASFAQARMMQSQQPPPIIPQPQPPVIVNPLPITAPPIIQTPPPVINNNADNTDDAEDAGNPENKDEVDMLIEEIIDELETENALDDSNEFINGLATDYPMEAMLLKTLCDKHTFAELLEILIGKAPHLLAPFLDPVTFQPNEKGKRLVGRLEEFYTYYKNKKE